MKSAIGIVNRKTLSNPNIEPDEDDLQAVMVEAAKDAAARRKSTHEALMKSLGSQNRKTVVLGKSIKF